MTTDKYMSELYHYGILGMKWGVRRYQNKDGSLTTAGRKRAGYSSGEKGEAKGFFKKRSSKKGSKSSDENKKEKKQEETLEAKKERILKSRSAAELYKNADLFTTSELQSAYTRLQAERNISQLIPDEIDKARDIVDRTVKWGGTINNAATTGIKLYNNIAKVYNTFSEEGKKKPMTIIGSNEKKTRETKKDD